MQATEEDGSSDDDLDDEAMIKLDKRLSVLFSEQKKKIQAKKDEKTKQQKEKMLLRDFKIKVPSICCLLKDLSDNSENVSLLHLTQSQSYLCVSTTKTGP